MRDVTYLDRVRAARMPVVTLPSKFTRDPLVAHVSPHPGSPVIVFRAGKPYAGFQTAAEALDAIGLWRKHCVAFANVKLEMYGPGVAHVAGAR